MNGDAAHLKAEVARCRRAPCSCGHHFASGELSPTGVEILALEVEPKLPPPEKLYDTAVDDPDAPEMSRVEPGKPRYVAL